MNVGNVGSLPVAASNSNDAANPVQEVSSVTVLKKAEDEQAEIARQLIASATGIGQNLDVKG